MRRAEVWRAAWETVRKPFLERRYTSRDLLYSPSYRRRARDRPNATSDHSLQPPHDAAGGSSGALLFSSRPWPRSYWVGTRKSPHYKKSDILLTHFNWQPRGRSTFYSSIHERSLRLPKLGEDLWDRREFFSSSSYRYFLQGRCSFTSTFPPSGRSLLHIKPFLRLQRRSMCPCRQQCRRASSPGFGGWTTTSLPGFTSRT